VRPADSRTLFLPRAVTWASQLVAEPGGNLFLPGCAACTATCQSANVGVRKLARSAPTASSR